MIILGCHIKDIQHTRIQAAIDYGKNNESQIWFLTGGVKNALESAVSISEAEHSEAEQMKELLFSESNVIIDTEASNTAENFANFKKWYQLAEFSIPPQIVITTSLFHKARAEKIFQGIFYDVDVQPVWNLSKLACSTCWSDEQFHMQNVESDVKKALSKN